MTIYKPSELQEFLSSLGITPKKRLSQNFLIDGNIIRKIAKTAEANQNDIILEIGPGPGSLTEALLDTKAHIIAVEKDEVLSQALDRLKTPDNHLDIFCADIMEFPLETVLDPLINKDHKAKTIANLPYHLTTPILIKLLPMHRYFSTIVVMVQEEVARRFTAAPKTAEYGSITVFLNFYADVKYAFTVSRHCFFPQPKVDSAIVVFHLKEPPNIPEALFFEMTRSAFQQRRKMLKSSLRTLYDPSIIMEKLQEVGLNPLARPEDLSLNDFLKLFQLLSAT